MFMSPTFKDKVANGTFDFSRAGVASSLVLPESIHKSISFDANVEGNKIVLSEGEAVYIMADEFGFKRGPQEEVEANIFFIDGGLVFELISGKIFLKGENGVIYSVDELGEVDYPSDHAMSIIKWVTHTDVFEHAVITQKFRYNTTPEQTATYVMNLVFNALFHHVNTTSGDIFKTQMVDVYEDLGLGVFQFINYNDQTLYSDDDHVDVSELEDVEDDEEEEDEFNMDKDEFAESF